MSECCQIHNAAPTPTRDSRSRFDTYEKMLVEVKAGFAMGTVEAVHGSMLVCQALFDYGEMVRASIATSRPSGLKY